MQPMRLQRYLAMCGLGSRRGAEALIRSGKVEVCAQGTEAGRGVATLGINVDPTRDKVFVEGKVVRPLARKLFLYHKPRGELSTMRDPQGRSCVGDALRRRGLGDCFNVGRLDRDVNGLLLVTNDGDFAQKLLHPSFAVKRVYWAVVAKAPTTATISSLIKGVALDDGIGRALQVRKINCSPRQSKLLGVLPESAVILELTVAEGRKHFVKKLLAAAGHPVRRLCRVSFGNFVLGDLAEGQLKPVRQELRGKGAKVGRNMRQGKGGRGYKV